MQQPTYAKSLGLLTASITLLTIAALAAFGLVAANWTWRWLAPLPTPLLEPVAVLTTGYLAVASRLFDGASVPRSESLAATGIAIRLLGIVAATAGQTGFAVLRLEPKQIVTVREGNEIAPGIRLAQVAVDHVVLDRGGVLETLTWPLDAQTARSGRQGAGS